MMTDDQLTEIASAHSTKAGKIRALNEAGVSTTDIAEYVGISYQHAYSVLLRAGLVGRAGVVGRTERTLKTEGRIVALELSGEGAVLLPPAMIAQLGVEPGDRLFCQETPEGIVFMSREAAIAQLQRSAREHMPDQLPLLDALIGRSRRSAKDQSG